MLYVSFEAGDNIKQKLNAIGSHFTVISSIHYWVLLKRSDDIRTLIRHMEENWSHVQRIDKHKMMLQRMPSSAASSPSSVG